MHTHTHTEILTPQKYLLLHTYRHTHLLVVHKTKGFLGAFGGGGSGTAIAGSGGGEGGGAGGMVVGRGRGAGGVGIWVVQFALRCDESACGADAW